MQQTINVGTTANDGTGDTLRVSQQKANSNFDELYARPDFTDAPSDGTLYGRKDGAWDSITALTTPNQEQVLNSGDRPIKIVDLVDGDYTIQAEDIGKYLYVTYPYLTPSRKIILPAMGDIQENGEIVIFNNTGMDPLIIDAETNFNNGFGGYFDKLRQNYKAILKYGLYESGIQGWTITYETDANPDATIQNHENLANILAENGESDGHNFHTFFQIDGALFAGERADGVHQPRFLKYPDKNDLTTFEYIQMTNAGTGINGFEAMCYNNSDSCFYGMLSNTSKIIKITAADISTYTITTMTDLPSGCTFAGSGGIVTDGTYLYIGTEQTPHSFIVKVRISDMTTIDSYEWSRPSIHGAQIDVSGGYAQFSTNGSDCYTLKVLLSDLTPTEKQLGANGITDDFAHVNADYVGYTMDIFGAENVVDGNRCKVYVHELDAVYDINFMPSTGIFFDPNTQTIFNCSSVGFVETITLESLVASVIDQTIPQETVINSFTMRGFWVNELALYWNGTSNEVYVTTWNNTTSGSIKKVELIYFPNALITREQLYYLGIMNGGSGAVDSVNGQTGVVVLDADDIADGTTNKAYTATEKTKLSGIATGANVGVVPNASITGATKTKITYDSKGLVTSGADATTADISDSTNKRYVTDAQLTVIGNTSGTNTGDETTSTIKTKLGITTLSGSNTGDQDLSGLVPTSRTVNSKALSSNVTLNTDDIAESGTPTNKWFTNARAIASTLTSFVSGAGTVSATDTILQAIQKIVGNIALKADLASPAFTGTPTAPTQSANDNSTKLATTAYVDTGLALKATKSDIMILSSAYVLSNSTSLQKAFNVGSGGGGAFNASANKTYRFRCELDMTGLSGSTSAISFGFLGTATISSLSYKSNAIKAVLSNVSGGTITSIQVATISAITATSTATGAKAMITGIIRVSSAGTIIPAVATGVGNSTSQVEANSFFEITELGSDTLTATSNIS